MCNRECMCKKCANGPCGCCKHNEEKINECRSGGLKECEFYEERQHDNRDLIQKIDDLTNFVQTLIDKKEMK